LCVFAGVIMLVLAAFSDLEPGYGALLLVLVAASRWARRFANRRAINQLLRNPDAPPDDFFRTYWRACSFWPPAGEVATRPIDPMSVDFTGRRKPLSGRLTLIHAAFDTAGVTSFLLQGHRELPGAEFMRLFDNTARLWTTRSAWHMRVRLEVHGLEYLDKVTEQAVVVFNHESLMDFCLTFYAVGGVKTGRGRRMRLRFLAAKNHFHDNVFIHSILGVGKAIASAGMIFVDRKTREAAAGVVTDSVEELRRQDVDLAVFPQGTRANGHFGADGKAFGAGYYTTSRKVAGFRHFRRGAADIAAELARHKAVDVLCVGIIGTANLLPRRSLVVNAGMTVQYHILPPIRIEQAADVDRVALLNRMELQLRRSAQVNQRLIAAWAREAGRSDDVRDRVAAALEPWSEAEEPIPFAALDVILSMPAAGRRPWFERFERLALGETSTEEWDAFRGEL